MNTQLGLVEVSVFAHVCMHGYLLYLSGYTPKGRMQKKFKTQHLYN